MTLLYNIITERVSSSSSPKMQILSEVGGELLTNFYPNFNRLQWSLFKSGTKITNYKSDEINIIRQGI